MIERGDKKDKNREKGRERSGDERERRGGERECKRETIEEDNGRERMRTERKRRGEERGGKQTQKERV
jgi:hypothetical protein